MNSHLGIKNVVIPERMKEGLFDLGAVAIGIYCIFADRVSRRGRIRLTEQEVIYISKTDENKVREAINVLWSLEIIELHQIISPDGQIDQFYYMESQDRRVGGN